LPGQEPDCNNEDEADKQVPGRCYPQRERGAPDRFGFAGMAGADNDTYSKGISWDNPTPKEAFTRADSPLWWDAVNSEMASLLAKNVYEEVQEADLPMNYRPLPSRLILKIKRDLKGNIDKYKCRLVAKGYQQVLGRDYDEVFAPTVETATLRTVLADMVERDAYAGQFDVSTAFLNGDLTEVVYLRLPKELGGGIWRLRKALYGLKQAARAWHMTLRKVMEELGYRVSGVDPCLFMRNNRPELIIVVIHVDDGVCTGPKLLVIAAITEIGNKLDIKQLGEAHVFLGLEIRRSGDRLWLGQEKIHFWYAGALQYEELQAGQNTDRGRQDSEQGGRGIGGRHALCGMCWSTDVHSNDDSPGHRIRCWLAVPLYGGANHGALASSEARSAVPCGHTQHRHCI
jgi:hypothetical protein